MKFLSAFSLKGISYFFLREYFTDAVRNTVSVVVPIGVFFYLGHIDVGIGIGVGALLISLTDGPGHIGNKLSTAKFSIPLFFFTSLGVGLSWQYPVLLAVVMVIFAFVYSMLAAWGSRLWLIGTVCLVLSAFVMGVRPQQALSFSLYVFLGGLWYFTISIAQVLLRPQRSLKHAIFECLMSSARYVRAKAGNYDLTVPLDSRQSELIQLHTDINQKHEQIRNLLLTDKHTMNAQNAERARLLERAFLIIELNEQLNTINFDYAYIRSQLQKYDVLPLVHELIQFLADQLEQLARLSYFPSGALKSQASSLYYQEKLAELDLKSASLPPADLDLLEKAKANIEELFRITEDIRLNQTSLVNTLNLEVEEVSLHEFIVKDLTPLWRHFSFSSPVFRFALRMSACFLVLHLSLPFVGFEEYSYWAFLTLVVVARPKFAHTWQRNFQRTKGTLIGVLIGMAIYLGVQDIGLRLTLCGFFLLGFYAFNRVDYMVSVVFVTPAVLIALEAYHGHIDEMMLGRIIFTILGCSVSFLAAYLLPIWDRDKIKVFIKEAGVKSSEYLMVSVQKNKGLITNKTAQRLARKDADVSLASLSEVVASATREPDAKRIDFEQLYKVQTSLYQLNAIVTSIYLLPVSDNRTADYDLDVKQIVSLLNVTDSLNIKELADAVRADRDRKYVYMGGTLLMKEKMGNLLVLARAFRYYYEQSQG